MASTGGGEWKSASWKQEEDHTGTADAVLTKINAVTVPVLLLAGTQSLPELLEEVLAVEKKARFGGDAISTQRCAVEVIKILRTLGHTEEMLKTVDILMKKRGQMKQVQSAIITEASEGLNSAALSRDARMDLLRQLKHQAEGKLHVELEHARFAMQLALLLVEGAPGDSPAAIETSKRQASDMLHSVQVETITNMPRLEKIDSVLMQLQLALDLNDAHRCQMLSRKMNPRALGKADTRQHKVEYFKRMAQYYERESQWFVMARCWHEIYLTIPGDDAELAALHSQHDDANVSLFGGTTKIQALSNCIVLAILAGHQTTKDVEDAAECTAFSKESSHTDRGAWLAELAKNRDAEGELPRLHALLKRLIGVELLRTDAAPTMSDLARSHPMLAGKPGRLTQLEERLSEHDITVIAKYYTRIHLSRLAQLVGLPEGPVEQFIMRLVTAKVLYAKIDRIEGVINFQRRANPITVTQQWNAGVESIATLVDRAVHLIAKERMLIAVAANNAAA